MKYRELIKRSEDGQLLVAGHFSEEELKDYKKQGYKININQFNKNGIRVEMNA